MLNKTAYDTTVGEMLNTQKIQKAILESIVRDRLQTINLNIQTSSLIKPVFITNYFSSESNIPLYAHPILIKGLRGEDYLCTDIRPFIKPVDDLEQTANPNQPIPKNMGEYQLAKSRAVLNLLWLTGSEQTIRLSLSFASQIYAQWISESISNRFALDARERLMLTVLAFAFYQYQFYSPSDSQSQLPGIIAHATSKLGLPSSFVEEVLTGLEPINTIDEFCQVIKTRLDNLRLKDFNSGILVTVVANSWYSYNAKEMIPVALEHPPTWIAIVHAAYTNKTYKNSVVSKLTYRYNRHGTADAFVKEFASIVLENTMSNDLLQFRHMN